jgi:hypothetical protein
LIETDADLTFGKVVNFPGVGYFTRTALIEAVKSFVVNIPTRTITVLPGSGIAVGGDSSEIRLNAKKIEMIGELYAGGGFDAFGDIEWTAGDGDVVLTGEEVKVGGMSPNLFGSPITRGGTIEATGDVTINVTGANKDFDLNSLSMISTLPVGSEAFADPNDPSMVTITAVRDVLLRGTIDASGPNAGVDAKGSQVLVDGIVSSDGIVSLEGSATDRPSVLVTQLLMLSDSQGRLIDNAGRLIDPQGRLINASGQFVNAQGQPLAEGAEPVFGGAPVRLAGGTVDASTVDIDATGSVSMLGQIGALNVVNGKLVSGTQNAQISADGKVTIGGRVQTDNTVDVRADEVEVTSGGVVLGKNRIHLFADQIKNLG